MLGVFGNIPAFDTYFIKSFSEIFREPNEKCGFSTVNKKSLMCINKFYSANLAEIDKESSSRKTTDILSGKGIDINYSKAKIIDLYGFYDGLEISKKLEEQKKSKT